MKRLIAAFGLGSMVVGCGAGRAYLPGVHRASYPDRYVSADAYAASLEAAIAEAEGDWPHAAEWLLRAREADPESLEVQVRLGLSLCHIGKKDAASFAFRDVLRVDGAMARAYTARASCALLTGETSRAIADLDRAMVADPDAIEPTLLRATIDERAGDRPHALARLEEAARLHPTSTLVSDALHRVRGDAPVDDEVKLDGTPRCLAVIAAVDALLSRAEHEAADAVVTSMKVECPSAADEAELHVLRARWTPTNALEIEAVARSMASTRAKAWGERMALRRVDTPALPLHLELEGVDRSTSAIVEARAILARCVDTASCAPALPRARQLLAAEPAEPTVARLVVAIFKKANVREAAIDERACALAWTDVEKRECAATK